MRNLQWKFYHPTHAPTHANGSEWRTHAESEGIRRILTERDRL
jgi:hypothetical protein